MRPGGIEPPSVPVKQPSDLSEEAWQGTMLPLYHGRKERCTHPSTGEVGGARDTRPPPGPRPSTPCYKGSVPASPAPNPAPQSGTKCH